MRDLLADKKRIVIKVGTTTITHEETGNLDLVKMEKFVRILKDLRNRGKEVIVVSSAAMAVGREALSIANRPEQLDVKQACAAVGQGRLMMVYQKLFGEYSQIIAQVLMTKYTITNDTSRRNAQATFNQLLHMGVIPIVNENDTVATDEIEFGDNDQLSAIVAALVKADLLVLISDIDGLYTDDPHFNENAKLIPLVESVNDHFANMAKGSSSDYGTGGMASKIVAARMACDAGADMMIINGNDINNLNRALSGEDIGTLFLSHQIEHFHLRNYIQ